MRKCTKLQVRVLSFSKIQDCVRRAAPGDAGAERGSAARGGRHREQPGPPSRGGRRWAAASPGAAARPGINAGDQQRLPTYDFFTVGLFLLDQTRTEVSHMLSMANSSACYRDSLHSAKFSLNLYLTNALCILNHICW